MLRQPESLNIRKKGDIQMKQLNNPFKNIYDIQDVLEISKIILLILVFLILQPVFFLKDKIISRKFRRKCRKAWRKIKATYSSIMNVVFNFKGRNLKERNLNKSETKQQYKVCAGQAKIVKRVYKPGYTEIRFLTGKTIEHEEKHYTYIEYQGRQYKLKGKELFLKYADSDTIQMSVNAVSKKKRVNGYFKTIDTEVIAA